MDLTSAQNVSGIKTFLTLPRSSVDPTIDDQLTRKGYVDSITPSRSLAIPNMDGVASPGSLSQYSSGDHIHPTDTSRAALNGSYDQDFAVSSLYSKSGTSHIARFGTIPYDNISQWRTQTATGVIANYLTLAQEGLFYSPNNVVEYTVWHSGNYTPSESIYGYYEHVSGTTTIYKGNATVTQGNVGMFTITHNLGGLNYHLNLTSVSNTRSSVSYNTKNANSIVVEVRDSVNALTNYSFYFEIKSI